MFPARYLLFCCIESSSSSATLHFQAVKLSVHCQFSSLFSLALLDGRRSCFCLVTPRGVLTLPGRCRLITSECRDLIPWLICAITPIHEFLFVFFHHDARFTSLIPLLNTRILPVRRRRSAIGGLISFTRGATLAHLGTIEGQEGAALMQRSQSHYTSGLTLNNTLVLICTQRTNQGDLGVLH